MKNLRKQAGFTLIELVVVIVILGILAATAAPKFIDLQDDARTATLDAVKASLESASSLIYSKSLIAGNEKSGTATVTANSDSIDIIFGYPASTLASPTDSDFANLGEMWTEGLIELDDTFTLATDEIAGSIYIYPEGTTPPDTATLTDPCTVIYTDPTAEGGTPTIVVNDC